MLYFTLFVLWACASGGTLGDTSARNKPPHSVENTIKAKTEYKKQSIEPDENKSNQSKSAYDETQVNQGKVSTVNSVPLMWKGYNYHETDESRFIWIPDGDGVMHEVDTNEPADDEDMAIDNSHIQYWLFTRQNPVVPQNLIYGNSSSVKLSHYDSRRPLNIIVHGWRSSKASDLNTEVTKAFLSIYNCNVVVVDWSKLANTEYIIVSKRVSHVGEKLGNFLDWLIHTFNGNWNSVHLVGHSLGAHVVGNAGRAVGGLAARITGLDPAGPFWRKSDIIWKLWKYALNAADGQYVEAIHTDIGELGITDPVGNVDFYANGGATQPGCRSHHCNHRRAYDYFAASIVHNAFRGRKCKNLNQAKANQCTGAYVLMGNTDVNKRGSGIYALSTGGEYPYYQ